MKSARSQVYLVLRFCERMQVSESAFYQAGYGEQMRWLAYELLRQEEEQFRNGVDG